MIGVKMSNLVTTPIQGELLLVECQAVIDDVEMGVLNTGEPYLTGRGCGGEMAVSPPLL